MILVANDTLMVLSVLDDTDTLNLKEKNATVVHSNGTSTTYPVVCNSYNAVPPTSDEHRYRYDPATNTFTDTWPYAELSKVQFIDRLQNDGGMTDVDLVASRNDANLEAFWLKFQLAESISRDDAKTDAGLNALVSLGYLTSAGKQAIMDNWGRERP